jgi:hypothetical protein
MMHEEEPGWSRSEWAHWWLDHDEVDEAARALEPGDSLAITRADFRDLAAALARRGLVGVFEDGNAFVYTREQVQTMAAAGDLDAMALGERRPPGRTTPAPTVTTGEPPAQALKRGA